MIAVPVKVTPLAERTQVLRVVMLRVMIQVSDGQHNLGSGYGMDAPVRLSAPRKPIGSLAAVAGPGEYPQPHHLPDARRRIKRLLFL